MAPSPALEISEAQVRHFRARRSHLIGPGAGDAVAAAGTILGAQAQQEGPALYGLSLRTRDRPTAAEVRDLLLASRPRLVRTWGQRDTLHLYDPRDWPTIIAARREWPQSGRRGAMPRPEDLAVARTAFEAADGPLFRRDLFELIPSRFVDEVAQHPGVGGSAVRFAAARLVWTLALEGLLCFAHKEGSEQAYVHRRHWLPDLEWPHPPDVEAATAGLARRYLAVNGPATAADLAHFFGSRVGLAHEWLERLSTEIVPVECGGRSGLVALERDLTELRQPAPTEWPVRLMPQWDTHLMRHKDKTWLLGTADEAPRVWRKAAVVAPTVLARGRIVATWSHRTTSREVRIEVSPLSGWQPELAAAVRAEAEALAAHLELPAVRLDLPA